MENSQQKISIGQIKASARENLLGNYSLLISASLLNTLIYSVILSPFMMMVQKNPNIIQLVIFCLAQVVITGLTTLFRCGVLHMHTSVVQKDPIAFAQFLICFKQNPNQILSAGLILGLTTLLCQIPASVFTGICVFASMQEKSVSPQLLLAMAVVCLICLVIYIFLQLQFALVPFLLIDPGTDGTSVFRTSCRLMKGRKCKYFWMMLSFLGLFFLGILSLGIGFLWIKPYILQTQTVFYQQLHTH